MPIPFQECGGALRKLASGFISRIDDRGDFMLWQLVGNGFLEVRREVAESEVVALEKQVSGDDSCELRYTLELALKP